MIINKDISPENQIYYIGGQILEIIKMQSTSLMYPTEIFYLLRKKQTVSFNLFSHALDWLYLLGAIDLSNKNLIKKCF